MGRQYVAALARVLPWLLAALGVAVLVTSAFLFIGSTGFGYDYLAYDAAARRLAGGGPLYPLGTAEAYNSGAYGGLYLYAPPLALALIPVAGFPAGAATLAWFFARIVLLGLGCAMLPVRRDVRLIVWFIASISFPVLYDLNLGNLSLVLFALGSAIWRWNGTTWAGVALAAALTVRQPFGIIGIAWILTRRVQSIAGAVAAGVVIVLATLPIVGIAGWTDYVTILRGLGDISTGPNNLSLGSPMTALGFGAPWSTVAMLAGVAASVIAVIAAARRQDPELAVVVALAGTLLFAPFFHPHYLVALLIPAAYVANRGRWWGYGLPLLGWLPGEILGFVAIAGIVAPFLAGPRPLRSQAR
jgi:Glycosyltransferase family 87